MRSNGRGRRLGACLWIIGPVIAALSAPIPADAFFASRIEHAAADGAARSLPVQYQESPSLGLPRPSQPASPGVDVPDRGGPALYGVDPDLSIKDDPGAPSDAVPEVNLPRDTFPAYEDPCQWEQRPAHCYM